MTRHIPHQHIKKILIIGHSNIGDLCYDLVVIEPLRRHFPQAAIIFLSSPRAYSLAGAHAGIDRIVVLDKEGEHKGLFGRIRLRNALAKERADLVIVLKDSLIARFLGISVVWNVRRVHRKEFTERTTHPINVYLAFLRAQGIVAEHAVFTFCPEREKEFCDSLLAKNNIEPSDTVVGIMPLSASPFKNWPVNKWNQLARVFKHTYHMKTLAFGLTGDNRYAHQVVERISSDIISVIDQTTLQQAVALIARCRFFVGADSSLLHVASCLGVETIGLYGPTPPDHIYPYFHRHNIIKVTEEPEGMSCLSDPFHCPCRKTPHPSLCMERIGVEDVLRVMKL